jgi:hypothetical protein
VSNSGIGRTCLVAALVVIAMLCRADSTAAQEAFKPVVLTEQQMEKYIATLPEIAAVRVAMRGRPDAELQAAFAVIVKKHGFESYAHFGLLSTTVAVVMTGIDPLTKTFTEPKVVLEEQIVSMTKIIDDLKADLKSQRSATGTADAAAELKPLMQLLDELKDGRGSIPATTAPGNVELVKKYFDKIITIAERR